jgi:hypothetical protein
MKYPKTIGVISDPHCGSHYGVLSPRSEDYKLKPGQRYLHKCLMWLAKNWPPLDLLIWNGDLVDGDQYKSKHAGLHTSILGEQWDIAIEVVEDFAKINKPRKMVRIDGTPYHEGFDRAGKVFDEHFKEYPSAYVGDILDLKLEGGAILNVKHQPEGGGGMYKGMILDREVLWTIVDEATNGAPKATHIIRSHLHCGLSLSTMGKVISLTPCFQLQTPHARKAHYRRWQPTIGGVLIERDELAENGYAIHTKKFKLPKRKARGYETL